MSRYVLALTTCNASESETIARTLVERRVCACVNIVPSVTSIYRWKGEIAHDSEHLLLIKTEKRLVDDLKRILPEAHSYEVPELIVIDITDGSSDYLSWVTGCVTPDE